MEAGRGGARSWSGLRGSRRRRRPLIAFAVLGCSAPQAPPEVIDIESDPVDDRSLMRNPLYRTQRPPRWPEGARERLIESDHIANIFTGLLVEVPFRGTAAPVMTYDMDLRVGHVEPTFPGLPTEDEHHWITWELPEGTEVLAPRKGRVSRADTTVGCASGDPQRGLRIASGWFGLDVELLGVVPSVQVGDPVAEGQAIGVVGPGDQRCRPTLALSVLTGNPWRGNPLMRKDVAPYFRLSSDDWARLLGRADAAKQIQDHALECQVGIARPEDCPLPRTGVHAP